MEFANLELNIKPYAAQDPAIVEWHHSKCFNWFDTKFKRLPDQEISSWLCNKFKQELETNQSDMAELEDKIQNLTQNQDLDHEYSLILAAGWKCAAKQKYLT